MVGMDKIFIDVREPFEFAMGHIKDAINIPPSKLMANDKILQTVPKNAEIILYCHSGSRSNAAKYYFERLGYLNVKNGINKDQINARYGILIVKP
jgi:rhodanese-related sulfurtransferase